MKSRHAALEAGDAALVANSFALCAYQRAFINEVDVDIARVSIQMIQPQTPATVRALIFDRAAWSFAVAGEVKETEQALDHAAKALEDSANVPSPDWASWVDDTELKIITGRCWSALRRPLRAVPVLTEALAGFPDAYARDKALYTLALADAYMHGSEVELAAETIASAHTLTAGVASTRPKRRIAHTLAQMAHLRSGAVADLRDRLKDDAQPSTAVSGVSD